MNDLVVFMHISKTAGASLRRIIHQQYKPVIALHSGTKINNFKKNPQEEGVEALIGHFDLSLIKLLKRPYKLITFVRHPVKQVISHFLHLITSDNPVHKKIINEHPTIESFCEHRLGNNLQFRHITSKNPKLNSYKNNLELAKSILKEYFYHIGTTETFNKDIELLQKKLNWEKVEIPKVNTSKEKENKIQNETLRKRFQDAKNPNQKTINLILEKNQLDLAIHEFISRQKNAI